MVTRRPHRNLVAPARFKDTLVSRTLERLHQMKKATSLPYKLEDLKWDSNHRQNFSHIYCYCGKEGIWFKSMLQCARCEQWFHERCLSPRPMSMPIMDGDPFYLFICSVCNSGKEILKRLDFDLIELVHLMLFNITITTLKKEHGFETDIMPFDESQSFLFQPPSDLSTLSPWERRERILDILLRHKDRFGVYRSKDLESSLWWLKSIAPPPGPRFRIPTPRLLSEKTVLEEVTIGRIKMDPSKLESAIPHYLLQSTVGRSDGSCSNSSSENSMAAPNRRSPCEKSISQKRSNGEIPSSIPKSENHTAQTTKTSQTNQSDKDIKLVIPKVARKFATNYKVPKPNHFLLCGTVSTSDDDQSSLGKTSDWSEPSSSAFSSSDDSGLLNKFIPQPSTFNGFNNPFGTLGFQTKESRRLVGTRQLRPDDLIKFRKLKKKRDPLPPTVSRLPWESSLVIATNGNGTDDHLQDQKLENDFSETSSSSEENGEKSIYQIVTRNQKKTIEKRKIVARKLDSFGVWHYLVEYG